MHGAAAIDEAARMARERMGQDVARLQQRHDLGEDGVGVDAVAAVLGKRPELPEVDVERLVGTARDLGRLLHHLDAPAREPAELGMRLEALDDVGVG
jgi:hypothetical protein